MCAKLRPRNWMPSSKKSGDPETITWSPREETKQAVMKGAQASGLILRENFFGAKQLSLEQETDLQAAFVFGIRGVPIGSASGSEGADSEEKPGQKRRRTGK